jgi:CAAX prenyl protease-like protein
MGNSEDLSSSAVVSGSDPASGGGWPGMPFVAPLAVFVLVTSVEKELSGLLTTSGAYGLKLLATTAVLLWYRRAWPRWETRGLLPATLLGVVGVVLWVLLDSVQRQVLGALNLADWLPSRDGWRFDLQQMSLVETLRLLLRFSGLVLVVPLAEELCWRGFLAPWLVHEDFRSVPAGKMTVSSFLIVLAVFTGMHPEILAAAVWVSGMNLLWQRTGNLWACVVAHATTNLLLGLYLVSTGSWHLW